jgi:hypothetical protein
MVKKGEKKMTGIRLKERDLKFLKFCGEQKFLFKNQVEDWFGVLGRLANKKSSERVARRQLARLKARGLLGDRASEFKAAKTWALTKTGIQLLKDQGLLSASASVGNDSQTINHDQWVTQVRLASLKRGLSWDWTPESALRAVSADRIPDAEVVFVSPKKGPMRIAIEIELTLKSETRLKTIFSAYDVSEHTMVLYFVATPQLRETLIKVSAGHSDKIFFCLISEFCDVSRDMVWRNANDSFKNENFIGGQNEFSK